MAVAKVLDITKRTVKWDKKLEIYTNGVDNVYPETMERFRNNSVSALMASNIMVQNLLGKGFGAADEIKIGDQRLADIADDLARDIVDNKGVFIHLNYDLNFRPSDFKVLPYNHCRLGVKDSREYNGKILVYKDWGGKIFKDKISVVDVFNPDPMIVEAQVMACEGHDVIEKLASYKGQIWFFNMDRRYYYPLARIDSVASEADNEYLASRYKNTNLRKGFFGKTLVVTRPLIENDLIEKAATGDKLALNDLKNAESERDAFQTGLKDFVGVEDQGGVMHMEMDFEGDEIDKNILFKNIESQIDDKMFAYSESSALEKILMAHNNLPKILVTSSDSSMFGQSGELIRAAKETYWENTSKERDIFVYILQSILELMPKHKAEKLIVAPLLKVTVDQDTAAVENQKAQAQLKGSVSGVQALLEIQKGVSAGTTTRPAAIKIIEVIYGIDPATAAEMLGDPASTPPGNVTG